jgi:hypothetical protein
MKLRIAISLYLIGSVCFGQLSPVSSASLKNYKFKEINGVKAIEAPKGKTFYQISIDLNIPMTILRKFNEFHLNKDIVIAGEIIYVERKKRKAKKTDSIVLKKKSTLREISRIEAVRLSSLLKYNQQYSADQDLSSGDRVFLRP